MVLFKVLLGRSPLCHTLPPTKTQTNLQTLGIYSTTSSTLSSKLQISCLDFFNPPRVFVQHSSGFFLSTNQPHTTPSPVFWGFLGPSSTIELLKRSLATPKTGRKRPSSGPHFQKIVSWVSHLDYPP